jgi:hypothetical protein
MKPFPISLSGGRSGGPKLGLQIKCYTLHWLGKRGMQWKELIPTFDEYLLTRPRSQVLLIQLGSNDLAILKSKGPPDLPPVRLAAQYTIEDPITHTC